MARIGMHEAKTTLSKLVERAKAGEDIILQRNGAPVARIVPFVDEPRSLAAVHGIWRDQVQFAEDFDDLPPDMADALGGG